MATPRRLGTENSKTRAALLDATERLMLDEGYAAVSSRRVAAVAGLKPQLVHYYFRTMDDLFLAVFRRGAEAGLARQAELLASDQPLWALWEMARTTPDTKLVMEFTALGNHRKVIQAEIVRYAEEFRAQQVDALTTHLAALGFDPERWPPAALLVVLASISRFLVMEESIGLSTGHDETVALVEHILAQLEGERDRD
jgi:TetR/AcrR family transcriptional regulator